MTLREIWNRLRDRRRRDELATELDDELRFHQHMLERDHAARGASSLEARRLGRLDLGNATHIKEETRDMWSLGWIDDLLQDLRYAARVLRHNAGFTLAIVLTLALGIGANTAIFSVVNAVVLRALPYADPDRLYSIWTVPVGTPTDRNPTSYPDLLDWQARSTVFTGIAGYVFNRFELSGPEGVDLARGITGTPNLYTVLGATPLRGRLPRADEDRTPVVAISHRLWLRRFGGNASAVGRTILMNEQLYTVVGVMPPGFHFPSPDIDLWFSMHPLLTTPAGASSPWLTSRGLRGYRTVARLRPGVGVAAAEAQMNAIMHRLGADFPDADGGTDIRLQSVRDDSVRGIEHALWLVLGAAGLVLMLACANVAHLMLARTSARAREIAVRRALGAHRGRVVRQLLTESVLLGVIGGAVGLGVAALSMRLLVRLSPGDIPRLENVALDSATLGFAAFVSILTGVLFGLAPAIVTWRSGVQGVLREQGRGAVGGQGTRTRTRTLLTAAEVAFALVLLVGAGLMIRSFATLLGKDLGFQSNGVLAFNVNLSGKRFATSTAKIDGLERALAAVRSLAGVKAAGASTSMPPARMQQANGFMIEGDPAPKPGQEPTAAFVPATPGFLTALSVPLIAGRYFTNSDDAKAPRVALISRELARRHFAGRDPLGRRLRVEDSLWTIVGVVGDVPYRGPSQPVEPVLYVPWAKSSFGSAWIAVKTDGDTRSVTGALRDALHAADPLMNPREVRTLDEMVGETMLRPRFQTWLLTTFGGLALILAAVGIYGVIAYGVAQRTSEIGLRLALGASPESVVGLLLRRGMVPVAAGLVVGLGGARVLSRLMASLLVDISPTDRMTFVATSLLLAAVAVLAGYVPAARAARLDPSAALRSE